MPELDLTAITLAKGSHENRDQGVCLMEAVAWWQGISHTDHPPCVSPVLGYFGRDLNDALADDSRQRLIPLIPLLPGTAGDGLDQVRGLMAADWLIREYLPAWLDLAGISHGLREQPPLSSWDAVEGIAPALQVLRGKAAAAWTAAEAAARAAAWTAAWTAAGDAAGDAAGAAAGAAAGDAAGAAAWAAARAAAWAAAWTAAWTALTPTVTRLQESAILLFRQMIEAGHNGL